MSEWVAALTKSLAEEFGEDRPRVCTLATVDKSGAPRARSVICRKVGEDGSVWFLIDGRSEKADHLKAVPQAEVVFWLPTVREQFAPLLLAPEMNMTRPMRFARQGPSHGVGQERGEVVDRGPALNLHFG